MHNINHILLKNSSKFHNNKKPFVKKYLESKLFNIKLHHNLYGYGT